MELECDLSKINNEELLRKMWQQSEDASRKKEIRSQLYKLRESRLRDLYQGDIMADNSGFGKNPLATSHGDALADQSFQSLKSKEIRDSLSPTEMKFQSMALNNPNTTGWNVQSSKEVSPDGRGFRAETVATTDGVESINGGTAEFKGRNEQRSSAHHQGDDKNFVKQAMESSNSHLQEKVVIGDENSGRTEVRTSSSKSTSSSQVFQSSSNVEYDDGYPRHQPQPQKYLMDSSNRPYEQDVQQHHQQEQQRLLEEQRIYEQQFQQQRQQHLNQQERRTTEQLSSTRQNTEQKNTSQNVQTQETHEQNKRYVDMDKASPEYQQHVQYLMQQPGEIISNTVEYPKPNVKMITTVKRLPDGTIVRNKRYETEEVAPTTPSTRTTTNQTQPRRDSQQPPSRNYQPDSAPQHSRPSQDMVDSSNTSRYVQDTHTDDVETKFSSIKKSSSKFSTESTSETIQEFDDRYPQGEPSSRPKAVTNDFSTHGFPSVRSNKLTQEYPSERPHTERPSQGFPSHGSPSKPTEAMVPRYTDATDNITERRVPTKDGEVIIVSSEKKRNYKTSSNSERIVETEHVIRDDQPYQQIPDKSQDFTTHGFPSAREPSGQQPKNYPSERQMQPQEQDFPLDKFSPGTRIIKHRSSPHGDDDVVVVSSQKSRTAKHSTNTERVIEHEIIRDDQPGGGYPRIQPHTDNSPYNYTVTTPGEQKPQAEFPGSPRKPNNVDFSTQGFPSVRTPGQSAPGDHEPYGDYPAGTPKTPSNDFTTQGFPSVKTPSRPAAGLPSTHGQHPSLPRRSPSQEHPTQGFPSVRTPTQGTPTQGYPSNVDAGRPNGTVEQPRATPTSKTQPRTPSPNKYKTPTTTVRETTERVIRKEKEVDSAHRAFAASLRSSSPIDHVRRDSYTTDSHTRHTPRSSVSSTRTFKRDMREGSHDSAPSETSRISTTTITRNTPPRTVGGKTVVTKVVTTKTNQGSNDTLNVTTPRVTKSPSPGKTVTTTTTTTRTLTSKDVPKVTGSPDNQHTGITTNNIDTIFPINEPTPLTTITKIKFSDNHKQPHKPKTNTNISKKKIKPVIRATTTPASAVLEEVIEPPCIKKHYYLLGPSDQLQAQSQLKTLTSQPLKTSAISEKSPTKKPQPTAPSSRSSTPSYNSRKPPTTSVMTDDYDDDDADKLNPTSPLSSPSSRSRTPQKIGPNDNDKPQDDWQTRPQRPDNDERRTVNRETTFEKDNDMPTEPRKPNYEQPNIEWVIVDDVDDYDHDDDDNDSFAPEVVDSKLNVKKTTSKLITQEKQTPIAPQRRPKSSTTTTVVTKQFHTIPSKPQTKPNDRSPLKIKPNDSRTPQQIRSQKPLTDSKSPAHTPLKGQPKVVDTQMPKGPKSTVPSYTSPLRKPLPKSNTEETTLRKTLKTSQVIKDKTNKLIEAEKPKRTPQSPERKPKSQTPGYRVTVTEVTQKRTTPKGRKPQDTAEEPIQSIPYETDDEPNQGRPSYKTPQGVDNEPNEHTPDYKKPLDTDDEPQGTPDYRKPYASDDEPNQYIPGYIKPQQTDDEPIQSSPGFRKPHDVDNEPYLGAPGYEIPQNTYDEPIYNIPGYRKPQETGGEPNQGSPGFQKPQNIYEEPNQHTPGYKKPQGTGDKPNQESPGFRKPQGTVEEPKKGSPAPRKPPSPGFKRLQDTFDERSPDYKKPISYDDEPNQDSPVFRKPEGTNDEPSYRSPGYIKPQDDDEPNRPGYETSKRIMEEQMTITETLEERYPDQEAPKRPDNKPSKYSPAFNRPRDTYDEPMQGTPFNRKPEDYEPSKHTPGYKKPHDADDVPYHDSRKPQDKEPNQHTPGYRKPYDNDQEPHQTYPGHRQPLYKDNEPNQSNPNLEKPLDTGNEPHYMIPQQVIEEEITITETSQKRYPDKETPQRPSQFTPGSRKPYDLDDEPKQGKPGTPGYVKPTETDEEPTTPGYRKQPQQTIPYNKDQKPETKPKYTKTGDKPVETDNDESESTITTSQRTVAKHIQKFETNLNKKSPKPPTRTKSPTKEAPQTQKKAPKTPLKETSPTRATTKPKMGKPRSDKPFDTEEDETFEETNEFVINSTQRRIVSEKQILEEKPTHPGKEPQKPSREVSPSGKPRKPGQTFPEEPTDKHPKTPKHVSPTRSPQKPKDDESFETTLRTKQVVTEKTTKQIVNEYPKYPDQKAPRGISPTRNLKKPEEPTGKRPQSPNKNVSPTRLQKQPEQKSPTKPTDGRPKSPSKHVSPTRTQKKPHERTPLDDEQYTTTLQTTKILREKITKDLNDEEYPEKKPKGVKPTDTDDDETFVETSEFITKSTQKRVVSEKEIITTEEPLHPDRKAPKIPTQKKPGQKFPEEPSNRRSQSPTKPVSPTRTHKKPDQTIPVDDQTFRKTLRTTETVTERLTKKFDGKVNPEEKTPSKKGDKPDKKTKPKEGKPHSDQPSDTDEDETITETSEFVTTSTNKRIVSKQDIQEFEEPRYPDNQKPTRVSKSPTRGVSPTPKQPGEQQPDARFKEPTGRRPQSPNKHVSPTRTQKKPNEKKPLDDDETFTTSLTTTKIIKENLTKGVTGKEYPEEEFPSKKGVKPEKTKPKEGKPYSDQPSDSEEDETITETSEFVTTSTNKRIVTKQDIQEFDESRYPDNKSPKYPDSQKPTRVSKSPTRGVSPTRKQPGEQQPEERFKKPTGRSPQSPNKHISPTRIQKKPNEKKPVDDDETFTTSITTTKIVKDKLTKGVTGKEYPEEEFPSKKGVKPEKTKPKEGKPHSDQPSDSEEDETITETSEFVTTSTNKRIVTKQDIQEFDEPRYPDNKSPKYPDTQKPTRVSKSPTRGVSPTRKQPGEQQPEEKLKEPMGRRPQSPNKHVSPTRTQKKPNEKKPLDDDETFTTSITTTKIVKEKLTKRVTGKEYPEEEFPSKKGDKPEKTKPKKGKPYSDQPSDTEEDETITETSMFVTKSTNKRTVTEQHVQEFEEPRYPDNKSPKYPGSQKPERDTQSPIKGVSPTRKQPSEPTGRRPQSPNKHVSPTRTQKKPNEKEPVDDDETITTSLTTTKIVKEKITKDTDDSKHSPKGRKPHSDRPIDEDETVIETSDYVINSTKKLIVSEKQILEKFGEPSYPGKKTPNKRPEKDSKSPTRGVSPTRTTSRPGQKLPEEPGLKEPTGKRPLSPTKPVSPTRNQRKPITDDETFKTTLRTTKTVTDKTTKKVDEEEYPDKKIPLRKGDKPDTEPEDQPSDTEETFTTTSDRVIGSKTHMVTEKLTKEFEKPKSPTRGVSPTRNQKKPGQKLPEEPDFMGPTGKRPQSPTRAEKKPGQQKPEEPTVKRPQSPTRSIKKPVNEDETLETGLRTSKTVIERTTKFVDDEEYPDEETPYKKGDKPDTKPKGRKPHSDKPSDTDEEETITETSERFISSKTCKVAEKLVQEFEEPESPTRGVSPTRTQKKPGQKLPEEPDFKEPTGKRPQSPTRDQKIPGQQTLEKPTGKRPQSPTRTQKKPTKEDETFKTTLRTTKTLSEKTTKYVDDEEYPEDKPDTKPKGRKPNSDKPSDTDEEETITETSERFISSKTSKVTEKLVQEFEESESPIRGVSPTRTQKKPGQKLPEEPDFKEPTGKRPQSPTRVQTQTPEQPGSKRPKSPTRNQKLPYQTLPEDEQIFTGTSRTTKITKTIKNEEFPDQEQPGKKPRHPDFVEPIEKRPKSPKKDLSPSRHEVVFDDDQTFRKTVRTTTTVTEKSTEDTPYGGEPTQSKPKSYKPTEPDGDEERFMQTSEFVIKTTHKPKYPNLEEPQEERPDKQMQPKYVRPGFEKRVDDKSFIHTSEFILSEKQTLETEKELLQPYNKRPMGPKGSPSSPNKERSPTRSPTPKTPKDSPKTVTPKDRKDSPTRSPSPKDPKSAPKSTPVDDETFRKTLRTTEIYTDKTKPKDRKPGQVKPTDTDDEEETTTETEEFLIETCEKRYVTERNVTSEKEDLISSTTLVKPLPQQPSEKKPQDKEPEQTKPKTKKPLDNKPETGKPINKSFASTYVETIETIEGQTYPEDSEQFPDNKKPYTAPLEPWLPNEAPKRTTKVNEQFIETERIRKETPDGAFISKTTEPTSPTTPTFKKKGTGRSDTFEERCRQILGMDTYGDTPGTFKQQPIVETEEKKTVITKDIKTKQEEDVKTTAVFQVKIEDCDEDDEPLSINSVKKTLHTQIHTKEPLREKPKEPKTGKKPLEEPEKRSTKPSTEKPQSTKKPVKEHPEDDENEYVQTITETTTIHKKTPKIKSIDETEPDSSEPETVEEEQFMIINKETKKSEVKVTKKSSPISSPRSVSPTKGTPTTPRSVSPTKPKSSPKKESPLRETPKRKPSKDTLEPKTNKTSPQKPDNDTTIRDRLRSSTRKTKSPGKQDQVDGSDSSPERSPSRHTERRRSSNISVTTEIIIEHTDSDTPNKKEKSPVPKKPKDSVFKEIIDSTVMPEKLTRRMPVTERKESAPVHRVTNKDKDSKMSRSTSENLIKVKKPEPQSLSPKATPKTTDHRRPNKCFATKSINLSATDRLVNSEDMENVIIDIQHAKSSREPSPDKIVPTPVPAHLDTGKPRYPDVVQEPEDDQPRRKPQVKNIPIFEEESNAYVGCHITEVERTHKTTYDSLDYEEQILNNPVVEAPPSLDYPSLDKPTDDESLLTVHEKVSKFQNIAEEVSKPKASEPFQREFDDSYRVPQDDECLLTINEKVEKFVKTSERVNEPKTKSPYDLDDEDEEFARNERIYTTVKLAPSAPQKSPELVRTISRHISRQNEPDSVDDEQEPGSTEVYPSTSRNDDFVECLVNNKKITTKEFEVSHHEHQQQKAIETTLKTAEKYQQPKDHDDDDHDDDELIPHTATHTTIIEERRQKDILSRPSVFDSKNKKPTTSTTTTVTTSKTPLKCNKSPIKDSEKLRPDIKSRTKPTSAVTNTLTETNKQQPKQSPQRKNSDIDYDLRGSGVETGVRNIISKQTKVYNSSSGSTKTNDLKKPTTSNKKPEKHMPVRLTPANNSDVYDLSADDDEMIITCDETTNIDFETQVVVNEDLTKETTRKIPLTTPHKIQTSPHSSTNSSPTDQTLNRKTKEHVEKLTERNPLKPNTVTTTSIKTTNETVERADDIDETVLEPTKKKPSSSSPHPNKTSKMSTTTTDSVAARRSLFESNNSSPSATPTKRTPLTSPMSGRRPSYMDHTKSSLEHTRRDSLEINKTNYSRKPSQPEEEGIDRNSMVKFEVPQSRRATTPRATSVTEDINVEEIFDIEVLEKLLETVQSYEIRRRIRAQIRLIKKNQKNELITSTTEVTTKTIKTSKVGSEEPDTVTTTKTITKKTKPEIKTTTQTVSKDAAASHVSSSKKEYIFEEPYMPTSRRSPKPNRYPYEQEKEPVHKPLRSQSPQSAESRRNAEHERQYESSHHSPEHHHHDTEVVREYGSRTTKQQYYYKDEQEHEQVQEITHESSPTRKSPSPTRKPQSIHSSPERRNASPESHKPLKTTTSERSRSPQATRVTSSRSPDSKTSTTSLRKSSATYEQQQETVKSSSSKPQTKRITTTTTTITKSKPEDKTPVWADRKNILKAPSNTTPTPKKPSTSTLDSRSGYTKTVKSTTSQKMTSNKSSFMEDDCVTSSYGIGPTDENGLPLFGIRALKKKKPTVEPSETTEEVTGYVVEEKYYSDNKSKPSVERKEFIYSTNPEELQKLKEQVEVSSSRKTLKDVDVKESRQTALISKGNAPALRSSPDDDFLDSTSKYVRRGSVKEMSEKFIQREASSTVTEKSNNYPKAGLILRTNSRKNSRDADNDNDNFESYKTTRVQQQQQHTSTVLADSDDNEHEYEVEEVASRHSGRFITESESECDSIKTQREFKKITSSSSSSMATRSFLNTQGEEKVITNVSECLERMRNADNVVEEGDTPEDQEARALLNKFLGASIIMKGVESSLPAGSNRQSKIITTTTTSNNNLSDDNDGDNNAKHEVLNLI